MSSVTKIVSSYGHYLVNMKMLIQKISAVCQAKKVTPVT